jgi:hypothetical protein
MSRFSLAIGLALLLTASLNAFADCRIVDATKDFWTISAQGEHGSAAQQTAAFRTRVIARYPGLYTKSVLGFGTDAALDAAVVKTLESIRHDESRTRNLRDDLVRQLPAFVAQFRQGLGISAATSRSIC